MNYVEDIFKKATVRGIADYLLFGRAPKNEERDYNTRLDDVYSKLENAVYQYDKDDAMKLLDLANNLENETRSVYLEIGMHVGIMLVKDISHNIGVEKLQKSNEINYHDMYNSLFKDVTCALEILQVSQEENVKKASKVLKDGQCRAEKIYVESE